VGLIATVEKKPSWDGLGGEMGKKRKERPKAWVKTEVGRAKSGQNQCTSSCKTQQKKSRVTTKGTLSGRSTGEKSGAERTKPPQETDGGEGFDRKTPRWGEPKEKLLKGGRGLAGERGGRNLVTNRTGHQQ